MYVVIIGCGRLGSSLAREFSNEGHDIAIIDSDRERLDVLGKGFNGNRISGIEYDKDILLEAGIQHADVFLAVCPDDNKNITASLIAKEFFNVPKIIARISSPEKASIYEKLYIEAINPTTIAKEIIKGKLMLDGIEILYRLDDGYEIIKLCVKKIKQTAVDEIEKAYKCTVLSIIRDGCFLMPDKDDLLAASDSIICTISSRHREKLYNRISRG